MEYLKLVDANIIKLIVVLIVCFLLIITMGVVIARNEINEKGKLFNTVLNFLIKVLNLTVLTIEIVFVMRILFWIIY
ncbi:MAG: hypothetical protein KIC98_04225 [Clostridioides difficile]|nr:hypothetical protein [Clostridioides sp.]MBS5787094.1 hypothetical protein [Clostridioides difficile]